MLATIRQFALGRLRDEDAAELPHSHAAYFLERAERAAPEITGVDAASWLARLDEDAGNFRVALDWFALDQPALLPRLAHQLLARWDKACT
jgi:hypothetical protein